MKCPCKNRLVPRSRFLKGRWTEVNSLPPSFRTFVGPFPFCNTVEISFRDQHCRMPSIAAQDTGRSIACNLVRKWSLISLSCLKMFYVSSLEKNYGRFWSPYCSTSMCKTSCNTRFEWIPVSFLGRCRTTCSVLEIQQIFTFLTQTCSWRHFKDLVNEKMPLHCNKFIFI